MENPSSSKTIIITGANGNLGLAVTKTFLDKGYKVIATVRNESAIKEIPAHPNLEVSLVNLSNENDAGAFVESTVAKYKNVHAVLMLVGGFAAGDITTTTGADIKQQFALNFETAYYVARPAFAHMMENDHGRLVFIGARPAIKPAQGKGLIAYALSKSLLFTLADFLNQTAKGKNVTATVVVPSTIDTPPNRESMPNADPSNWVTPAALAEILEFIVSDAASPVRETVLKVYNNA